MPFDLQNIEYNPQVVAGLSSSADSAKAGGAQKGSSFYRRFVKRGLDAALVLLSLPVVAPVILILAVLVALDGHNPFYTQLRVGRGGKSFRMLKLRSMVPNADAMLAAYLEKNPDAKAEWDATQKLKRDPRITRIGRIIRKTSLDELPQLVNVLTGSMSLVGPRPMMVSQKELYPGTGYFELRPGLTGLWQISDRNECDFRDRVKYDDAYNQMVSFPVDVAVILRTVRVVLRGTGY